MLHDSRQVGVGCVRNLSPSSGKNPTNLYKLGSSAVKIPLSPQVQPTLAVPSTYLELFQLPVLPCSSYENRRVWIGDQDAQYLDSSYRAHVDPCTTLDGVYQDFFLISKYVVVFWVMT